MTTIGVLGAGQLGRMLALAGVPLGLRFRFLDPSPNPPAAALGEHVQGSFEDRDALERFARGVEAVCAHQYVALKHLSCKEVMVM